MQKYIEYKKILASVFIINILLVSFHKGEFWPFSIFPMFSQAGKPWSRGVVEQVQDTTRGDLWQTKPLSEIRERVVPLQKYGIDEIDYANFISKTQNWDEKRIQGLRDLLKFEEHPGDLWMATRVTGRLTGNDSVVVEIIPMFLFSGDTTYKNPTLFPG